MTWDMDKQMSPKDQSLTLNQSLAVCIFMNFLMCLYTHVVFWCSQTYIRLLSVWSWQLVQWTNQVQKEGCVRQVFLTFSWKIISSFLRISRSKLCINLFSLELSRRLETTGRGWFDIPHNPIKNPIMNVINILELVGIMNAGVCYTEIKAKLAH